MSNYITFNDAITDFQNLIRKTTFITFPILNTIEKTEFYIKV